MDCLQRYHDMSKENQENLQEMWNTIDAYSSVDRILVFHARFSFTGALVT